MGTFKDLNCYGSLRSAIGFSTRDWSLNHSDAWMYGIMIGWDTALEDVAKLHSWDNDTIDRLKQLREDFISFKTFLLEIRRNK